VSAKLTPEICINKAASNSRLTAAGRQATAVDLSPDSFYFFSSLSLPLMRKQPNYTYMLKKLTETVLHLNLGHLVSFFFFFVQFCSPLCLRFDETTT
jgi:hypothetical protein